MKLKKDIDKEMHGKISLPTTSINYMQMCVCCSAIAQMKMKDVDQTIGRQSGQSK